MTTAKDIPTKQQCLDAMHSLREAYESALLGYWDNGTDYHRCNIHRHLKSAANELGYTLGRETQEIHEAPKPESADDAPSLAVPL